MKTQLSNMDLIDFSSNFRSLIHQLKLTESLVEAKQSLSKVLQTKQALLRLFIFFPGLLSKITISLNQLLLDINIHRKTIAMLEKQRDFVFSEQIKPYADECMTNFENVFLSLKILSDSQVGKSDHLDIVRAVKKNSKKWTNERCKNDPEILLEKVECYFTMKNILAKN